MRTSSAKTLLMLVIALFITSSCTKEHSSADYYPLKKNNSWTYTGLMSRVTIIEENKQLNRTDYILVYLDSVNVPIWKEKHIKIDGKIYWKTFSPQSPFIPEITFDPPLLTTPYSTKIGEKKTIESIETRLDSTLTTAHIIAEYEIESIENVTLPIGVFPECIKMRITISYPESVEKPYMAGTSYYWFAKDVGPVSYILTSGQGNLTGASLSGKNIP